MSSMVFVVVFALSISLTQSQGQFRSFIDLICTPRLCSACPSQRGNNIWCNICDCEPKKDPCKDVVCRFDERCKVVKTRGWFPRTYGTCVKSEKAKPTTTTTTTTTTTVPSTTSPPLATNNPDGVACVFDSDCNFNEFCQQVTDQDLGTCTSITQRNLDARCLAEKRSGPCRAGFTKYFFNSESGKCEEFFYGGCNPSANNFDSLTECRRICPEAVDPCQLPKDFGSCRAILTRYFFNSESGQCEEFGYGGCGGNANKFESLEGCEETCGSKRR